MDNVFKQFEKTIQVNNLPVSVQVRVYARQSDIALEDIIGDAENQDDLERKIERGDLSIMDVSVVCIGLGGMTGLDSLGGCYISNPSDVEMYLTDHGMVENSINDFIQMVLTQAKLLAPYIGGAK